jgi:hypothetical protein
VFFSYSYSYVIYILYISTTKTYIYDILCRKNPKFFMYRQNGSGDFPDISTVYANCQIRRIRMGVIPGKMF